MPNIFIPLGGGNEIGASCYYLEADGHKFIFDCGSRQKADEMYPDYSYLKNNIIDNMNDIEMVFISHSHFDHIGSLPALYNLVPGAFFCCTDTTKKLTHLQLCEFNRGVDRYKSKKIRDCQIAMTENAVNALTPIPLNRKAEYNGFCITLYPSGHMPGASMILLETQNNKILYSGDFSFSTPSGINSICKDALSPDILILCGTYAYNHNFYSTYHEISNQIKSCIGKEKNILFLNKNLAKFIDLVYMINGSKFNFPVYLNNDRETVADKYESAGFRVFSEKIKGMQHYPKGFHAYISSTTVGFENYEVINADIFSLHATYEEIKSFVRKQNAKINFIVHTYPYGDGLIDEMRNKYNIVQCENLKTYRW